MTWKSLAKSMAKIWLQRTAPGLPLTYPRSRPRARGRRSHRSPTSRLSHDELQNMAAMELAHPNAVILESLGMKALLTTIRRKSTTQRDYVVCCDRLCSMLAEEALARLPETAYDVPVVTPCGTLETGSVVTVPSGGICLVDIMRSGAILQEAVRKVAPDAKTAKILIQRDEKTALPALMYSKLPPNIATLNVLLCDPMLATGGSALMAIDVLKDAGVPEHRITFANVVSCPEGLKNLEKNAPRVKVVTCACDARLDGSKYIVPGLGDFGDRYFGTAGYDEKLWGC